MSSNSNHINPVITLDNYEEYFILYMDNELNEQQSAMVVSFIQQHPELEIELDMLMETRLPAETFSFDKSSLLSIPSHSNFAEEDLLLYIDNELPEEKKKIVQLEIEANTNYQQLYQQVLRTKLDPSEQLPYPNKKELYRHERKVIAFSVWLRVAAVFILVAALSVLFLVNRNNETLPGNAVAVRPAANEIRNEKTNPDVKKNLPANNELAVVGNENITVKEAPSEKKDLKSKTLIQRAVKTEKTELAVNTQVAVINTNDAVMSPVDYEPSNSVRTASIEIPKQSFNNKVVTMDHVDPYNKITASMQSAVYAETAVNNGNKKGSFKSLLRKATRFVEKTTGIDPSNGDEELLIGAVALKL
jgi:hypothetical protein